MSLVRAQVAYPKIEASFNLTGLATDPYDYAATDVKVQITQPDATTITVPAFFDGGTLWRVRHTPMAPGLYQIAAITLNGSAAAFSNLTPASWTVGGEPTSLGYVRIDPSDARKFVTDDGRRFFPVGENVAWDQTVNVSDAMVKLGVARANCSRIWMNHWDGKNLDWPNTGAVLPRGQLNLTVAQKWDTIVANAEQNGVYFQMTLQHHGQYSSNVDPNWPQNPYNAAVTSVNGFASTNGFLTNAVQFFTNTTAKALTKRKLRYAVARWGYSPAIMAWELFNEVQFTDAAQAGRWDLIAAWHNEMAQFLRDQDPYHHLVVTSSDNFSQPHWNAMDYYQYHNYAADIITPSRDALEPPPTSPIRPNFAGESTQQSFTTGSPRIWVQAALWPSLMAAQSGDTCPWWWDTSASQTNYVFFRSASDFVSLSGLKDQNALVKYAPTITGGVLSALAFAPGGGFVTNTGPDNFTVTTGAPTGIGTAPSYLQGNFHRTDFRMTNGYTFLVNYPQSGTFAVQITTIALSGANLQIFLDGVSQTNIAFPATPSDVNTNFTATIPVSAGAHALKVYNPGQDWVLLGNFTLNPYVAALGAYAVANPDFNATWVWHRTNLLSNTAGPAVVGTVDVVGLNAGTYAATWWDTFTGAAISNFTLTVAISNASVTVPTPAVLRSTALFVGKAPAATLTAPSLTRTLGSNSPAIALPLTITNSGGLPLAYSLSITGATLTAYSATTSLQPGGPMFVWKDLSAIGQEITGSFSALAAPKVAADEGTAGPFNIGFAFPFFSGAQSSGVYTQLYVSPNGFVAFSPFAGDTSTNRALPAVQAPTNMIALFWDDLDLSTGQGRLFLDRDPIHGTFTLQFHNVRFKSSGSTVSCQLILKTTGEIVLQYLSAGIPNACTVGLQNAAGNQGLQLAFNSAFVQNNLAVRLTPTPWLRLSRNAGLVPKADADPFSVVLDPTGLAYGTYNAGLLIATGDPTQPSVSLPIALAVTPLATWRQTHFGAPDNIGSAADNADPDGDGLVNLLEYAFAADPLAPSPNPVSLSTLNGHLVLTFQRPHPAPSDLTYRYEVTDDLASGVWNSGPTFTTENVVDNLDGTETVTVSDNAAPPDPQSHFLRVRISAP